MCACSVTEDKLRADRGYEQVIEILHQLCSCAPESNERLQFALKIVEQLYGKDKAEETAGTGT